jgi:predicted nucleic acid-binding protein
MKIFLDANILVSVVNHEYPLFGYTSRILSLATHRDFEVYTSPICLAIAFYFAEKKSGSKMAKKKLELLVSKIQIATVDRKVVFDAAGDMRVLDFEDGLEYYAALTAGCKIVVTEDIGDFYFSEIEVLDSKSFILKFFGK